MSEQMIDVGRVILMPRGNYASDIQYDYLDFVLYNGATYVAKRSVVGVTPTDSSYWQRMSDSVEMSEAKLQEINDALEDAKTEINSVKESAVDDVEQSVQERLPDIIDTATEQVHEALAEQVGYVVQQTDLCRGYAESARQDKESIEANISTAQSAADYAEEKADYIASLIDGISEIDTQYNLIRNYAEQVEENTAKTARYTQNAQNYMNNASVSETRAKASETAAKLSENAAKTSENNAASSEQNAQTYANNAHTYYTQAQDISEILLNTLHSDVALQDVTGATATVDNGKVKLLWSDPGDIIYEDIFRTIWDGTKVVRKEGSIPTNPTDGVTVVDAKVRNMYASYPYEDSTVEYGITYYYRWFPYSTSGVYTNGTSVNADVSPIKIYTTPSQDGVLYYNGNQQTASFADFDQTMLTVSGITGTNVGEYTAMFTPKSGYSWANNSTQPRAVRWEIRKAIIATQPVQSNVLTYNERTQEPVWNNYNTTQLTISGDTNGINAGTYTAIFTPTNNYCWENQSVAPISVNWTINKHAGNIVLSNNSVQLDNEHSTQTITISGATGIVSVSSSNTAVANVSLDGNTITISSPSQDPGTATITVAVAESENYSSTTKQINVTSKFLKIVSWSSGTDAEICSMVDAAIEGKIDLTDYWSVGDERQITLNPITSSHTGENQPAQTVTFVLAHEGLYEFSSSITTNSEGVAMAPKSTDLSNRIAVSFVVTMKNNLSNSGYMNSTDTNEGSWRDCARRSWCNDEFYNAIPETIRPIFAEFKTRTIDVYNGSELQTTNDHFALVAAKEIVGEETRLNAVESAALTQFDYYASSVANRVKKNGGNAESQSVGSGSYSLTRSPYKSSSQYFCNVDPNGAMDRGKASNIYGVSVFGCIK